MPLLMTALVGVHQVDVVSGRLNACLRFGNASPAHVRHRRSENQFGIVERLSTVMHHEPIAATARFSAVFGGERNSADDGSMINWLISALAASRSDRPTVAALVDGRRLRIVGQSEQRRCRQTFGRDCPVENHAPISAKTANPKNNSACFGWLMAR